MSRFHEDEDGGYNDEDCNEAIHAEERRLAMMEDAADEDRGKSAAERVKEWAGMDIKKEGE